MTPHERVGVDENCAGFLLHLNIGSGTPCLQHPCFLLTFLDKPTFFFLSIGSIWGLLCIFNIKAVNSSNRSSVHQDASYADQSRFGIDTGREAYKPKFTQLSNLQSFASKFKSACAMLPPHVDQLRSPRAGSDKTQLPFSPSRNKIKLKRKVWLSKEFHLISIKESVSLALRFVLQPAGIKGTAKKLFGFFHDLRQGGQKGAGTGNEEDTS